MMKLPQGRIPLIPLMGAPGIALTQTTLKENLTDAETQFRTLFALLERFHPDGIFLFMDLTVEAEALGLKIRFPEHEPPSVREHPVKNFSSLHSLQSSWHGIGGRMPVFIKTMEKLSRVSDAINGCYVIGPLTLAGELMGVRDLALASMENEPFVLQMLEFTTGAVTEYACAFINAGADIVAVLEPTAVMFSPVQFEVYCAKYFKQIQDSLDRRCILHVCGNTTHLLPRMVQTDAFGLSLDSMVDFETISQKIPSEMYLIGNINPVAIFLQGTVQDMKEEVCTLCNKIKNKSRFILSSGCDLPVGIPLGNIEAFFEIGRTMSIN